MVKVFTNRQDVPEYGRQVVDVVERLGFTDWEYVPLHPIPEANRRVQVREEEHLAPSTSVAQLRVAMKNPASKIPPVVVSRDGYQIDGNSRAEAARKNGATTFPAIVLKEDFQGASPDVKKRMHLLGAALNTRHGKGIDRNEIRQAVLVVGADGGYSSANIASLLNITASTVEGIFDELRAQERAKDLGIDLPENSMSATSLRLLGANAKMHDEPLSGLMKFAVASGAGQTELRQLINKIKAAPSDAQALALIKSEREVWEPQIAKRRAEAAERGDNGKPKPFKAPLTAQLRQHLAFVLDKNADDFVERVPTRIEGHLSDIRHAVTVLKQVIALQAELMEAAE